MKASKIKTGDVLLLEKSGTLVWVQEITTLWVKVVALPDQPEGYDARVFTSGAVRAKAISPFLDEKPLAPQTLSERNRVFIENLDALRAEHGLTFIDQPQPDPIISEENPMVKKSKSKGPVTKAAAKIEPRYKLFTSKSLDKAIAKNPRFEKGRGRRVIEALRGLSDATGTFAQVVSAVNKDGAKKLADPEKVVRRALNQLVLPAFGEVVSRID